jgi:hypothetical protein
MMKLLAAALGLALAGPALATPALTGTQNRLETLDGQYSSTAPEDWGGGAFGRRAFSFDHGRWTLDFTLALDPAFARKVFAFRTGGTYRVIGAAAAVPGAFQADFREESKNVTLLTSDAAIATAFGLAACGLAVGVEKDVSQAGCAAWKPVSACPQDHDLLALDAAGGLYFGVRPADNDMCAPERRPTALLPAVVKN